VLAASGSLTGGLKCSPIKSKRPPYPDGRRLLFIGKGFPTLRPADFAVANESGTA
jgi:hypothetical protein